MDFDAKVINREVGDPVAGNTYLVSVSGIDFAARKHDILDIKRYIWNRIPTVGLKPRDSFVACIDPGNSLRVIIQGGIQRQPYKFLDDIVTLTFDLPYAKPENNYKTSSSLIVKIANKDEPSENEPGKFPTP